MVRLCVLLLLVAAVVPAASFEAYFAPYDTSTTLGPDSGPNNTDVSALQTDLALIKNVTSAFLAHRAAGGDVTATGAGNPFQIVFCVYNLLDFSYIDPLIAAAKAGVRVQVLMDIKNLQEPYVSTYRVFQAAGLNVTANKTVNQKSLTPDQKEYLNLIGIDVTGIMHMKLRYFSWKDGAGAPHEAVVSGSLNPENTALTNEDTLIVVRDSAAIAQYKAAVSAVLELGEADNNYDEGRALNVLFSQATQQKGSEATDQVRQVMLDLVRSETEAIFLSVYSLRNIIAGSADLVGAVCAAKQRGVAVAVLTDKGQADGEAGFAGGDNSLTALRFWRCGIPTYKCENYAGRFSAFHHKNALFGLTKRSIVFTDTANWSAASMGNGTSAAKPHNSETTVVLNSTKLDGGVVGKRFLSNFMQLVRKYAYQQACPYLKPGTKVEEHANCATNMKWNQPDWVQPNANNVTAGLIAAAAAAWPKVSTTFSAKLSHARSGSGLAGSPSLSYSVNGGAAATAALTSAAGGLWSATVAIPFGSSVDLAFTGSDGVVQIKHPGAVVDAAFDWNAEPPTRRSTADLCSMQQTILSP